MDIKTILICIVWEADKKLEIKKTINNSIRDKAATNVHSFSFCFIMQALNS